MGQNQETHFLVIEVILAHCRKCEKPNNIQNEDRCNVTLNATIESKFL